MTVIEFVVPDTPLRSPLVSNAKSPSSKSSFASKVSKISWSRPSGFSSLISNRTGYTPGYIATRRLVETYGVKGSLKVNYRGEEAILDTAKAVKNIKKKGVKILSYFIQSSTTETKEKELNENFQIMYGKEASFIDPKNVNEVTKTLNSLFLERNLIS